MLKEETGAFIVAVGRRETGEAVKSLRKFVRSHASFVDHVPGKSASPCFPWEEEEGAYVHQVMFIREMWDVTV